MDYVLHIAILICLYSLITLTTNILLGYLGILYLAAPAIFGMGAYTFAILTTKAAISFPIALIAAGVVAMLGGMLLSIPSFRLKSHYIGMSTLAFLFIFNGLTYNLRNLTRGALGIPGIPRPTVFGQYLSTNFEFFLFALVITLIICIILYKILHSPFAKTIETIREDETAAKTLGKNIITIKLQTFAISTFFAGIAGGLLASYLGFISPQNFAVPELTYELAMVIVGGMASYWGSIVGAIVLVLLPEPLRFLDLPADLAGGLRFGIYGLLIILFMLFKPNGILGKRTNIFSK